MKHPRGHVVSLRDDDAGARAIVDVDSAVVCARCESGKGCGAGLLGRNAGDKRIEALVVKNLDIRSGDFVSVELAPRNILRAAIVVYGYPLAGAILATIAAFAAELNDANAVLAVLLGLVVGILVARTRLGKAHCLRNFTPMIVDKLPQALD
jgi:sigma-E factor negative regulatory protein RseC